MQSIRQQKQKEVTDAGYSVDALVVELTRIMVESEVGGERQCSTFAAIITSEDEYKTLMAQQSKKIQLLTKTQAAGSRQKNASAGAQSSTGNSNNNSNINNPNNASYYGGYNNSNNSGRGNQWGNGNKGGSGTGMFCHSCNKFYAERGQKAEKDATIRSHNTGDCLHKKKTNNSFKGGGKGGGNNAKGAKKGENKKGKGKKGKGKKGGHKGGQ